MNKFDVRPSGDNETNRKIDMYINPETAKIFADREKNDREHTIMSQTIDSLITDFFNEKNIQMANLGAGANPQKYEKVLSKVRNGSGLDWVDISSEMLKIAASKENLPKNIHFITNDFMGYLNSKMNDSLDCVFMQYAINYINSDSLNEFFKTLSDKLKTDGVFVANLGAKVLENNPQASFLVNKEEFVGKKILMQGDRYTINFLNPDGTIFSSTDKNFFSNDEMLSASTASGLTTEIKKINEIEMIIAKK